MKNLNEPVVTGQKRRGHLRSAAEFIISSMGQYHLYGMGYLGTGQMGAIRRKLPSNKPVKNNQDLAH